MKGGGQRDLGTTGLSRGPGMCGVKLQIPKQPWQVREGAGGGWGGHLEPEFGRILPMRRSAKAKQLVLGSVT